MTLRLALVDDTLASLALVELRRSSYTLRYRPGVLDDEQLAVVLMVNDPEAERELLDASGDEGFVNVRWSVYDHSGAERQLTSTFLLLREG